jgi:hypothetical protein
MTHSHDERPPSALAHGCAKPDDIEEARRQLTTAEHRAAKQKARHWRGVMRRAMDRQARASGR